MKTSSTGLHLIESYEGLILGAYDDYNDKILKPGEEARGTLTIGYGHTSSAGSPRVYPGMTITKQRAEEILAADLGRVENEVNKMVSVPINQNQFDALVSFHFNTGGLGRSTTLKKLNAKDYQGAADALLNWTRANGQDNLPGLVRRRKAERSLFLTPVSAPKTNTAANTAVVVGGAAAVSQAPHLWPWIVGGTLVAMVLITLGIHFYHNKKAIPTNVQVNSK